MNLIEHLGLEPHPEGGYYRQVYKSPRLVTPDRSAVTAIYFLLTAGQFSRWHRVRSDEIWIHLEGAPLTLRLFDGSAASSTALTTASRIVTVPADVWQAAEIDGEYTLVSCIVAPGFEFEDFEMMTDATALAKVAPELTRLV